MARAIDCPSEVLPTPGGPAKHRIGAFAVGRELAHGQVLDDALLDLFQPEMVLIEDAAGLCDIDGLLLGQGPGQLDEPVEIGPEHSGLRRAFGHALVAV